MTADRRTAYALAKEPPAVKAALAHWLDGHMREVLRGTLTAAPLRAIGTGLAFGLNVLLARLLGADDAGLYFLALTIAGVASTIGTLGLGHVLVRHTAANAARDDPVSAAAIARLGLRISLVCAVAVAALLLLVGPWAVDALLDKPELGRPLQWMALAIVPQTQMQLHSQLLRGLKKIALSQIVRKIDVPLLNMLFLALLAGAYGLAGAVWSFLLANLITAVAAAWAWRRAIGPRAARQEQGSADPEAVAAGDLLRSGAPLLQTNLMNLLLGPLAMLLLGSMAPAAAVAIFAVAFRTARLSRFALMSVNSIAAPKFAALHSTADVKALATTARRSALLITLMASPLLFVLLVFPDRAMGLFGPEFVAGASVLTVLALGQFVAAACGSVGYLLMMSGREKLLRNQAALAALVGLGLNLLLIPELGALGAAIAVSSAIALRSLLGSYQVYRHLGVLPFFIPASAEAPDDS